jgi:hypothetical protein
MWCRDGYLSGSTAGRSARVNAPDDERPWLPARSRSGSQRRDAIGSKRPRRALALTGLAVVAVVSAAAHGAGARAAAPTQGEPPLDPAQLSTTVDNPLFPASTLRSKTMRGTEHDEESGRLIRVRIETRLLRRTRRVAGVPVLAVQDRDFESGRLVERTLDYFAQDPAGNVWYFGESVDDIERGRVVGHEGQWLAGRRGARPGFFMPARPRVGQTFDQERAPGVAEDRSTVLAVGIQLRTPAGVFRGCVKTRDFAPLDRVAETKYYCPRVGLARQLDRRGGKIEVVRFA